MNVIRKIMTLSALLLIWGGVRAQAWNIEPMEGEKKIALSLAHPLTDMRVQILDPSDRVILDQYLGKKDMPGRIFNLQDLEPGQYEFHFYGDLTEVKQPFRIAAHSLEMEEEAEVYYGPSIRLERDQLDVTYFNKEKEEVFVRIEDPNGRVIFENQFDDRAPLEKRFDLAQLQRGRYQLVMGTARKQYYRQFLIRQ